MNLSCVSHIVLYRPYRASTDSPLEYALFTDPREAMSFHGSHSRYCSTMELCKVDVRLTDELLRDLIQAR